MIQPERQILPSVSTVGSGQSFCGSCPLPDWRKQAGFDHNGNIKLAFYDGLLTSTCLDQS